MEDGRPIMGLSRDEYEEVYPIPINMVNTEKVELTKSEADALKNHLEWSILAEIRSDEGYDNFGYLRTLIHVYEKCSEVTR